MLNYYVELVGVVIAHMYLQTVSSHGRLSRTFEFVCNHLVFVAHCSYITWTLTCIHPHTFMQVEWEREQERAMELEKDRERALESDRLRKKASAEPKVRNMCILHVVLLCRRCH